MLDDIAIYARFEGEACLANLNHTEVPATELGDLADLFEAIRQETGATFIAARV